MKLVRTDLSKLCHARPGDLVQLTNEPGEMQPELYLVCRHFTGQKKVRPNMSHGLYDENNELFLVNIENGEARSMPHLSERVNIIRDAGVDPGPSYKGVGE